MPTSEATKIKNSKMNIQCFILLFLLLIQVFNNHSFDISYYIMESEPFAFGSAAPFNLLFQPSLPRRSPACFRNFLDNKEDIFLWSIKRFRNGFCYIFSRVLINQNYTVLN